jgi:ABC-type multidrug transport system fused ATPase/permease subunit
MFFKQESVGLFFMVLISFMISLLKTNGISIITANLIDSLRTLNEVDASKYYTYFMIISILCIILYYIYDHLTDLILTKLRQWIKYQLIEMLLVVNTYDFSEMNFTKINSPINRIANECFATISDVIQNLLPAAVFLIIITGYFIYKDWIFGLSFFIGNIILILYGIFSWEELSHLNEIHETHVNQNESYILELLNNVDKIVSRGQVKREMQTFSDKTDQSINKANVFYSAVNKHTSIMNVIIYCILFISVGYLLWRFFKKDLDFKGFVAIFSILILYRDRSGTVVNGMPSFIDFLGRAEATMKHFIGTADAYDKITNTKFTPINLPFDTIQFDNITFKYKKAETYVYQNKDLLINMDNKIIGITGPSGRGKSTFAKLLIKLYKPESGKIYIDGQDIENIDVDYLRDNITYINQSSKLFDKKIIENMLYGCIDDVTCSERIKQVLKYDKIKKLFTNMDIYETKAGSLGEGVSGGQRQVVNIISGLIHPSKILILDEPTNALDGELKRELLEVIKEFKEHKKCIFIITHDKEVETIMTDVLSL